MENLLGSMDSEKQNRTESPAVFSMSLFISLFCESGVCSGRDDGAGRSWSIAASPCSVAGAHPDGQAATVAGEGSEARHGHRPQRLADEEGMKTIPRVSSIILVNGGARFVSCVWLHRWSWARGEPRSSYRGSTLHREDSSLHYSVLGALGSSTAPASHWSRGNL
ncbi:hypothetical protein SETIT_8G243600v2 [Setaria italica]|uniref:Uncharacterized protein n=1 Tax=Setaria italica TaxID=4555 RepID=A0A368SBG6_SETIT|nr:hypothetical protein SETIT_8G243600v2 [Setaria italica]